MTYETRAVLAGAYVGRLANRSLLTHAVSVDDTGAEVGTLCMRVRLDSLADRNAHDPTEAPTCKACSRRLARLQRSKP